MKKIIYLVSAMLFSLGMAAQNEGGVKDRTIVVEKEYNPDINDADKINVLPKTEKKSSPKTDVEYSVTTNEYRGTYDFTPIKSDYAVERPEKAEQLYMHAGYGNNGMADAGLYYNSPLFRNNEIKFNVTFDGVDDKRKPFEGRAGMNDVEWNSRYYRTMSGLSYRHDFGNMEIYANAGFGLDNFNYRPALGNVFTDDRQRHTKADGRVGFKSDGFENLLFDVFVDYSYFNKAYNFEKNNTYNSENAVRLNASVGYRFGNSSILNVDFTTRNYNYSMDGLDGYTTVGLCPSYTFRNDNVRLKLGINLDVSTNGDAVFNTSPDVAFDYTFAGKYNLYVNAGGGRTETDYRYLESVNPYWNPNFMDDASLGEYGKINFSKNYKVLATQVGIKGNPFAGFTFDVNGGFDMNNGDIFIVAFPEESKYTQYSSMVQQKSTVLYGNIGVSYFYKDRLSLNLKSRLMKWGKADKDYLALKPKYEIDFNADARIVADLFLNMSYKYIGRTDSSVAGNINDLSAKLSYRFFRGLGVYIRANNIISADNNYYYMYPSSSASVLLGLDFKF